MTNEVKNVPELRFPEFSGEWEENILGEVVIIKSGWSPSNFEKKDASVLLIKVDDLNYSSRMINNSKLKVNENNKYKKIKKDSIIFPKRGAAILTNKVRILGIDSYMDSNMMALEPKKINSEFLFTFIGKTGLYKIADTSTIPQINNKHIEPYNILLPSSTEQKYIGDFFSKLDRQIELEEQKLEKLEEQKKGYMQKIFSQELRFKDGSGNEYPEWEDVKLQNIANIKKGEQIKKENIDNNGKYYHLNGGTTASSRTNLFNTNPFTISISEGGNSCGFIKMNKEYFFSGGHNYTLLDLSVSNFYLYSYLKYHEKKIMSLRVGSGLPNIQKKDISNYLIKIPRKEEQEKIGSFFKNLDEFIEKQANKVELLKQRKQSFLQKMFV